MRFSLSLALVIFCFNNILAQSNDPWVGIWTSETSYEAWDVYDNSINAYSYPRYKTQTFLRIQKRGQGYSVQKKRLNLEDTTMVEYKHYKFEYADNRAIEISETSDYSNPDKQITYYVQEFHRLTLEDDVIAKRCFKFHTFIAEGPLVITDSNEYIDDEPTYYYKDAW